MKRYVVEKLIKNTDGDRLVKIEVHESKPKRFSYVVWV